jgi:ABC-type antimicrobial peptide transport system permease subunit
MYFAAEEPIGRQFSFGGKYTVEIVGVVGDARYRSVESPADPTFFLSITQNHERWPFLSFTAWGDGDPDTLATGLRDAIRHADPNQPVTRIRSYDAAVATALASRRFNTTLLTLFAFAALLLAGVGAYGVMAYAVSTRTRELGVRAALGARPADLMRLVLRQGATLTLVAVSLGFLASLLASNLMRTMLFGVQPQDITVLTLVAIILTAVALTATWLPASRAVRVAPITALRE